MEISNGLKRFQSFTDYKKQKDELPTKTSVNDFYSPSPTNRSRNWYSMTETDSESEQRKFKISKPKLDPKVSKFFKSKQKEQGENVEVDEKPSEKSDSWPIQYPKPTVPSGSRPKTARNGRKIIVDELRSSYDVPSIAPSKDSSTTENIMPNILNLESDNIQYEQDFEHVKSARSDKSKSVTFFGLQENKNINLEVDEKSSDSDLFKNLKTISSEDENLNYQSDFDSRNSGSRGFGNYTPDFDNSKSSRNSSRLSKIESKCSIYSTSSFKSNLSDLETINILSSSESKKTETLETFPITSSKIESNISKPHTPILDVPKQIHAIFKPDLIHDSIQTLTPRHEKVQVQQIPKTKSIQTDIKHTDLALIAQKDEILSFILNLVEKPKTQEQQETFKPANINVNPILMTDPISGVNVANQLSVVNLLKQQLALTRHFTDSAKNLRDISYNNLFNKTSNNKMTGDEYTRQFQLVDTSKCKRLKQKKDRRIRIKRVSKSENSKESTLVNETISKIDGHQHPQDEDNLKVNNQQIAYEPTHVKTQKFEPKVETRFKCPEHNIIMPTNYNFIQTDVNLDITPDDIDKMVERQKLSTIKLLKKLNLAIHV